MSRPTTIEAILDLARWAPSGDNVQPARFEILDARRARVHGFDTRAHVVYDLDGWASRLSLGAIIETAAIAATTQGGRLEMARRAADEAAVAVYELEFIPDPAVQPDALAAAITQRSVQRRPYRTTPLSAADKQALADALGPRHEVRWLEGSALRRGMAGLMFRSARLRLVMPEAYAVHRDIIEWNARHSIDRVPDQALGVGVPLLRTMKFVLASWGRVRFFNRFLAGTWMPRLQMDLWPAWRCAAHFVLLSRQPSAGVDDDVAAGRALQRFWLTATQRGLSLQPEMTPLIFARYAQAGRRFSTLPGASEAATQVGARLRALAGADVVERGAFLGRIGHGPAVVARSLRKDLRDLQLDAAAKP
jgi:hypothetical protein